VGEGRIGLPHYERVPTGLGAHAQMDHLAHA
jgi:hypothetical protein